MINIVGKELFKIGNYSVNCNVGFQSGVNLIVGKNGIGKSSFMRYCKEHTHLFSPYKICFMDQFPVSPIISLRVNDIIEILSEEVDFFSREEAFFLIDKFKFNKQLDREVRLLSGGENQILKFIMTLSLNTDLYFLDEPLQYLDGENLEMIVKEIKKRSSEKTFLIIEHKKDFSKFENINKIEFKKENENIEIRNKNGI